MELLWIIAIGFLAGALAKLLMPGKDPGGFVITILLGIAGSLLATWLGRTVGWYQAGEGAGFIGAVLGAIAILAVYRLILSATGSHGGKPSASH
ncbi:MAG: GlsB/YeaQ/YmgE family stress response membrane protein [Chitinivibrionales bacterium]|nr:GlsB/YeaQ/YmgE family stress response membrane protein [Chitinivibrionales bacterium]MBD3357813.1 GlsB/YeaQ/YmgE family stress response membrane protein [Chitinivibrionales bacterium]